MPQAEHKAVAVSDDSTDDPEAPAKEPEALPEPKRFVLSPVEDGGFAKGLPTITAVYVGQPGSTPDPKALTRIDGGTVDFDKAVPTELQISIFIAPVEEDFADDHFSEVFSYSLTADVKTIAMFKDNIAKVKCFTFAISTDDYSFTCNINTKTSDATESSCSYRLLH